MLIPFVAANLGVSAQKFSRHPNTRISLTRSFMLPSTLVSVKLTHGIMPSPFPSTKAQEGACTGSAHWNTGTDWMNKGPIMGPLTLFCCCGYTTPCRRMDSTQHISQIQIPRLEWIGCEFHTHTQSLGSCVVKCKLQCTTFDSQRIAQQTRGKDHVWGRELWTQSKRFNNSIVRPENRGLSQ